MFLISSAPKALERSLLGSCTRRKINNYLKKYLSISERKRKERKEKAVKGKAGKEKRGMGKGERKKEKGRQKREKSTCF